MMDFSTFDSPTQRVEVTIKALLEVGRIGISADLFFMDAQAVGINLARAAVTIAQVREWQDQLLTRHRDLTGNVQDFVWRYTCGRTTDLLERPEDTPDVSNIVAGDTTIVILRALGLALCEGVKQHLSWEGVEAVNQLSLEIERRLEQPSYEGFEE
jgi:hypothetical protein